MEALQETTEPFVFKTYIPETDVIPEHGYMMMNDIVALLRKYKHDPDKVQFIADILEE